MPPDGPTSRKGSSSGGDIGNRDVIFEFIPAGNGVKASAIDVATGVEVSIAGPAGAGAQGELKRVALAKLMQRLEREGHIVRKPLPPEKNGGNNGRGGIVV